MSNKSSNKPPRVMKSKDELLAELRQSQDWVKKMDFTKNKFYPALLKASMSVDDCKFFLSSISTTLMQTFLEIMKEKRFGELNLPSKLDKDHVKYKEWVEVLELFNDETIFTAKELIEGMKSEIDMFCNEVWKNKPLSDLPAKWLDE